MNWVYSTGTEKPERVPMIEQIEPEAEFSPPLPGSYWSSTSRRTASQIPPQPVTNEAKHLEVGSSSVVLTVYTAEIDVELSQRISAGLHRSTKKNPPRALTYELIYVCRPPLHQSPSMLICLSDGEGRVRREQERG